MNSRIRALAAHLDCDADDIHPAEYGENTFSGPGRSEWLVLTDAQATQAARAYVTDSLWAFRPAFLAERTGLPAEVFEAIQANNRCESNNDTIRKLVDKCDPKRFRGFAKSAIDADGRGHFLSSYDGEEQEVRVGRTTYYLYRTN